jgi:hypothetical protein
VFGLSKGYWFSGADIHQILCLANLCSCRDWCFFISRGNFLPAIEFQLSAFFSPSLLPEPGDDGPPWLTLLGRTRDSLWSLDLFGCESVTLRTHWVLVVMDHCSRRIIGFGIHAGTVKARRCAGCSSKRSEGDQLSTSISVPITTPCTGFTHGKRICERSTS